ncbi:MAG TPA: GDSL-type esterase/lipase family protein, partial [Thermoanaerobaculia bacterium]|nr:GDSL-type esterase/lipase family protein [Thermoanaerobaculia bacterium]
MVRRLALLLIVIAVALRIHEVYRGPSRVPAHVAQHVVIVGDSVARGLGAHLAGVVNLGIDGARTYTVRARFDGMRSALRDADAIVMSIGGNDLFGDSMARTASMLMPDLAMRVASSRVDRLVRTIRRENAHARIYLLGL